MSDETQVATETENTVEPNEVAEVVTAEATEQAEPQVSEKDERGRAIARMERRINRKHAEAAAAHERVRMLEERLQSYEKDKPAEKVEVDLAEFESAVERRAAEKAAQAEFTKQCNAVAAKGKAEFPDFSESIANVAVEMPLFDRKGGATPAMQVVLEADNPPALLNYLGKNPDVVSELADLTPTQLSRRLDRIEREIAAAPKTSSAPKPLTPVKATATETGLASAKTDEEWARLREKELKERRAR